MLGRSRCDHAKRRAPARVTLSAKLRLLNDEAHAPQRRHAAAGDARYGRRIGLSALALCPDIRPCSIWCQTPSRATRQRWESRAPLMTVQRVPAPIRVVALGKRRVKQPGPDGARTPRPVPSGRAEDRSSGPAEVWPVKVVGTGEHTIGKKEGRPAWHWPRAQPANHPSWHGSSKRGARPRKWWSSRCGGAMLKAARESWLNMAASIGPAAPHCRPQATGRLCSNKHGCAIVYGWCGDVGSARRVMMPRTWGA